VSVNYTLGANEPLYDLRMGTPFPNAFFHDMTDSCITVFPILQELQQSMPPGVQRIGALISGRACEVHMRSLLPNVLFLHSSTCNGRDGDHATGCTTNQAIMQRARRLDWRTTRRDRASCVTALREAHVAKLGLDSSAAYVATVKTVVIIVRKGNGTRRWLNLETLVSGLENNRGKVPVDIKYLYGSEPVSEVVRLMHGAWLMIHIHGAGIANAIYMSPRSAGVIEVTFRRPLPLPGSNAYVPRSSALGPNGAELNAYVWRSNTDVLAPHHVPSLVVALEPCNVVLSFTNLRIHVLYF